MTLRTELHGGGDLLGREPFLWDLARQAHIAQTVPADNPQPHGVWCPWATSDFCAAADLRTRRMRMSLWGPPERLTLSMLKTDVWDRRFRWEPPVTLAEAVAGAMSEANAAEAATDPWPMRGKSGYLLETGGRTERYMAWRAYPFPCPKPVGQALILCPDLCGASSPVSRTRCDDGTTALRCEVGESWLEAIWLPLMTRNLLALRLTWSNVRDLAFRLYRHRDTAHLFGTVENRRREDYDYEADSDLGCPIDAPQSGADGGFFWIRQRLPGDKTFPDGFETVLMATTGSVGASFECAENEIGLGSYAAQPILPDTEANRLMPFVPAYDRLRSTPGAAATVSLDAGRGDATILLAVVTSADSADPMVAARRLLLDASEAGFSGLRSENAAWFKELYDRREQGRIFCGGIEATRSSIPELFRSWSSAEWRTDPDPTRYECDESYVWFESDSHPWHGMPCYNEFYFTGEAVRNRTDRLMYFQRLIAHWLEAGRENAREVFDLPGMMIAHGYLPPVKGDRFCHSTSVWEFCMEIPAQILRHAWDIWDYGGDEAFLTDKVYPALRDLALFYARYLSAGTDGYLHMVPSMSAEHWGWTPGLARNRDSASALAMTTWTFRRLIEAADLLGRDAELRAECAECLVRLAPYPEAATDEGPVYGDVDGVDPIGVHYNFYPGVMIAQLADEIHLDSPAEQIEQMIRTARLTRGWKNRETFHLMGVYPDRLKGVLASEFGQDQPDEMIDSDQVLRRLCERQPERLLNSRGGTLHLFPCVPPDATVAFRGFQARGGFLVSAEMVSGEVKWVDIVARRGIACRLRTPWPGRAVRITNAGDGRPVPMRVEHGRYTYLCFDTVPDGILCLEPA